MTELTHPEMTGLAGGGFWSGVACGLGISSRLPAPPKLLSPDQRGSGRASYPGS